MSSNEESTSESTSKPPPSAAAAVEASKASESNKSLFGSTTTTTTTTAISNNAKNNNNNNANMINRGFLEDETTLLFGNKVVQVFDGIWGLIQKYIRIHVSSLPFLGDEDDDDTIHTMGTTIGTAAAGSVTTDSTSDDDDDDTINTLNTFNTMNTMNTIKAKPNGKQVLISLMEETYAKYLDIAEAYTTRNVFCLPPKYLCQPGEANSGFRSDKYRQRVIEDFLERKRLRDAAVAVAATNSDATTDAEGTDGIENGNENSENDSKPSAIHNNENDDSKKSSVSQQQSQPTNTTMSTDTATTPATSTTTSIKEQPIPKKMDLPSKEEIPSEQERNTLLQELVEHRQRLRNEKARQIALQVQYSKYQSLVMAIRSIKANNGGDGGATVDSNSNAPNTPTTPTPTTSTAAAISTSTSTASSQQQQQEKIQEILIQAKKLLSQESTVTTLTSTGQSTLSELATMKSQRDEDATNKNETFEFSKEMKIASLAAKKGDDGLVGSTSEGVGGSDDDGSAVPVTMGQEYEQKKKKTKILNQPLWKKK